MEYLIFLTNFIYSLLSIRLIKNKLQIIAHINSLKSSSITPWQPNHSSGRHKYPSADWQQVRVQSRPASAEPSLCREQTAQDGLWNYLELFYTTLMNVTSRTRTHTNLMESVHVSIVGLGLSCRGYFSMIFIYIALCNMSQNIIIILEIMFCALQSKFKYLYS